MWRLGLLISEHAFLWTNGVSLRRAGTRQFRRVEAFCHLDHKTGVARLNKKTARRFVFQNVIHWRRPVRSSSAYQRQRDFMACPSHDQSIGARRDGGTWLKEN